MMVSAFAIKATNAFDTCEKRRRSSPMHSAPGRVALCAQPRMAPIYPTRLRINAQPQLRNGLSDGLEDEHRRFSKSAEMQGGRNVHITIGGVIPLNLIKLHASSPLSQVNLGDRLAVGTSELKLARFKRAVLTAASNGILDPETAISLRA